MGILHKNHICKHVSTMEQISILPSAHLAKCILFLPNENHICFNGWYIW